MAILWTGFIALLLTLVVVLSLAVVAVVCFGIFVAVVDLWGNIPNWAKWAFVGLWITLWIIGS